MKLSVKVRWLIEGARSGHEGVEIVHLVVKPTHGDLDTSLVITTDRRAYHLRLKSHATQWMQVIAFSYPEETVKLEIQVLGYEKGEGKLGLSAPKDMLLLRGEIDHRPRRFNAKDE